MYPVGLPFFLYYNANREKITPQCICAFFFKWILRNLVTILTLPK